MMRNVLLVFVLMAACALQGCGWLFGDEGYFRDREDDYRTARAIPPMRVPEGKGSSAIEPLYPIPTAQTEVLLGKEFEVPRPAPLLGDQEENVVRIQKLGEDQWILLDGGPSEIWPRIRSFLISNRIGIEREDASTGIIETAWLTFKADTSKREKYRFRVEQGIQRNSTEIYVQQMGYIRPEGVEMPEPEWQAKSMDFEREGWMVRELAGYLADTSGESSVSLLAQGISTANKIYMTRGSDGRPVIDLRLPFERAWASLGRALERGEFVVEDLNRDSGVYFVKYEPKATEEGEEGFFSKLKWWGDDEDERPGAGRQYRVRMHEAENGVTIDMERDDEQPFDEGEAEFLLGVVKANLS